MSEAGVAYMVVFLVDDAERRLMHFPTMDAAMAVARTGQVIVSGVFERTKVLGLAWNTTAQVPVTKLSQTIAPATPKSPSESSTDLASSSSL